MSFLHRFGSALNHHVHLHACVTHCVFMPTGDGLPAFLPARPITQADLATLPEKVRRRVVRWFHMQRLLDADAAAVTALAIGNVGKRRDAATGGHAVGGHAACGDATGDGCDSCDQPRSHDTSRRQRPN